MAVFFVGLHAEGVRVPAIGSTTNDAKAINEAGRDSNETRPPRAPDDVAPEEYGRSSSAQNAKKIMLKTVCETQAAHVLWTSMAIRCCGRQCVAMICSNCSLTCRRARVKRAQADARRASSQGPAR
jgi:hypothetical protein